MINLEKLNEKIKLIADLVQRIINTQIEKRRGNYKQWKEDQERLKKEFEERKRKIRDRMKELGYKVD